MDTSHLAEHAGTAGSLFASIFVVATLSMRTMIPLRVFGILTNLILITTAIPTHNYRDADPALGAAAAQRLPAAPDAAAGARREEIGQQRPVDGMAEAVHDRAQMRQPARCCSTRTRRPRSMFYIVSGRFRLVESGIELPVGAIVGELGMLSPSNTRTQTLECIEGGVILSRQLRPGRAALRAEPGLRLLLPSARQRPAVSEHRDAGAAAGPPTRRRRSRPSRSRREHRERWHGRRRPVSSFRYLFADFLGEDDDEPPFLPEGLPETVAPVVSDAIHLLIDYQSLGYARLYVDRSALRRPARRRRGNARRYRAADGDAHGLRGSDPDRAVEACRTR